MSKSIYAVYGAAGYGREVMPLLRAHLVKQGISNEQLVFVDDGSDVDSVNGHRVIPYAEFLALPAACKYMTIAIAHNETRQRLTEKCLADGILLSSVVAENAVVMDGVDCGEGMILSPFVTVTSNVKIGLGFHANIYSYVAHDSVIGDYVTFAPGVMCNGNVMIEDHAYLGTGAIIRQGEPGRPLVIGRGAVVGMGAVVTKNVAPGVTVVGNPARPLEKR